MEDARKRALAVIKSYDGKEEVTQIQEYNKNGYIIMKNIFDEEFIDRWLLNKSRVEIQQDPSKRQLNPIQKWNGVMPLLDYYAKMGKNKTVERGVGRKDAAIPNADFKNEIETIFKEKEITQFLKTAVDKNGKYQTMNIMVISPNSEEQQLHIDSDWETGKHYCTVLIPLIKQTMETGGTRVWPGSHKDSDFEANNKPFIDVISPMIEKGDALIFSGQLSHLGMANVSKTIERYIFYASFSSFEDPNVI